MEDHSRQGKHKVQIPWCGSKLRMFKEEQGGQCGWQAMSQRENDRNKRKSQGQDYISPLQAIVLTGHNIYT